jgi:very-short-patch-repair endonuclease
MPTPRSFGPIGELAAARHGAFTRAQAASVGITRAVIDRFLRLGHLVEPVPGVFVVVGAPNTWRQRLTVATLASNDVGTAGMRSGAALHRFDGYRAGPLEIIVPNTRRIALPDVVVRRRLLSTDEVLEVDGIRCTSVARTLCDIAGIDPLERVRVAFESVWRNGYSLGWLQSTAERLTGLRMVGPKRILQLVDEARRHGTPAGSALEIAVEQALLAIPGMVRQHEVRRVDGSFVARVDFAVPTLKIAIEAHSRQFHFGPTAESADAEREAALQAEGWIVRYVTNAQRRNATALAHSVRQLIDARRRHLAA